jgi:CubicO group peptidase (beta-lactamase class C family)
VRLDMSTTSVTRLTDVVQRGIDAAHHTGAQIHVLHRGRVAIDLAIGLAAPGRPMTTDTLMLWMSAGKPVTAIAIAQLVDAKLLDLDAPVARFVPEFSANAKERITLRHCLTHTGGFRGPMNNFAAGNWDELIARVCALRPEAGWEPGARAGYHIATSWFILGEVVRRVSGIDFAHYVRQKIFEPVGADGCSIGLSAAEYERMLPRLAMLPSTERGELNWQTPANAAASATISRPGANARGTMRELALLYQTLLDGGISPATGARILSAESAAEIVRPHRIGMLDLTFGHVIDWGLGFLVNSAPYSAAKPYHYGPLASPATFGHSGNQSSVGFADPPRGLVVAAAFNGMPGEALHHERMRQVIGAIDAVID